MKTIYVWLVSFVVSAGAFTGILITPNTLWAQTPKPSQGQPRTSQNNDDDDDDELEKTPTPSRAIQKAKKPVAPSRLSKQQASKAPLPKKAKPKQTKRPRSTKPQASKPSKKAKRARRKPIKRLKVVHRPLYKAKAGRKVDIMIVVEGEWFARAIQLQYRVFGQSRYRTVPFLRGEQGRYYATIPAKNVTHPGIEYCIVAVNLNKKEQFQFANRNVPHRMYIRRKNKLGRWLAKLKRHDGTRSTLGIMGEFNSYGAHAGLRTRESPKGNTKTLDAFYNLELWYTYRILGIFYQITVGYGRLRGDVPLETFNGSTTSQTVLRAGLDYGFSRLYMEFHKYFGIDLKLVLGASDLGFDGGVGATLRIGNLAETHLDLGFEIISRMGWTVFFELAWDTVPWFMMALRAEVTTMPFFDDRAVAARAYFKAHIRFHKHFHAFVNIGYGRRRIIPQGGPLLQVGLLANF